MKITYIHNCRIPTEKAHGYQIAKMCEAFSNNGAEVELIVPARQNHIKENIFDYYKVKNNFSIKYLKFIDFLAWPWLPQQIGFALISLEFLVLAFFQKIGKDKIIYTRSPEIAWLFSLRGYKTFFECHQLPKKKSTVFGWLLKNTDGIITITNGLKQDLVKDYNYPTAKILTAPDGVDLDTFDIKITREQARAQLVLPLDKKIVLYTGHLFTWKGVDTLAQASKKIPDDILIYTVGGDENEIKNFNKRNPNHKIINVPAVSREDVAIWLKAADLLVLPNSAKEKISEKYTSPLKLFEYMASGTPIIASDLPSIREIITNEASFFFPDNTNSLKEAIQNALNPICISQNKQPYLLDIDRYTWARRAENINNFIRKYA